MARSPTSPTHRGERRGRPWRARHPKALDASAQEHAARPGRCRYPRADTAATPCPRTAPPKCLTPIEKAVPGDERHGQQPRDHEEGAASPAAGRRSGRDPAAGTRRTRLRTRCDALRRPLGVCIAGYRIGSPSGRRRPPCRRHRSAILGPPSAILAAADAGDARSASSPRSRTSPPRSIASSISGASARPSQQLRAQNAGGPALVVPRRSDHGQQPDGRPPRLGPHLQGPLPALPRHARPGPALAERLRLPGPVGRGQRRARAGLHQQARHRDATASPSS